MAVAAIALIVVAPLLLVIALLVKLTSPGPVLFVQWRVGLDRRSPQSNGRADSHPRRRIDYGGRLFKIYKFRTMHVTDDARQVWARPGDPRITPLGRVLRAYRLDELPQLFNVLKGDMNIVGPRPEQPQIFQELRATVNDYAWRQRVPPGITGWAQVNAGYDQSMDDVRRKLTFDLEYIQRHSVVEDIKIMARTVPVMLLRKGSV